MFNIAVRNLPVWTNYRRSLKTDSQITSHVYSLIKLLQIPCHSLFNCCVIMAMNYGYCFTSLHERQCERQAL